jgi:hypothetical protein
MKERILRLMERRLVFSGHAVGRMLQPSRRLTKDEVREAIRKGEIVEQRRPDVVTIQSSNPPVCVVVALCRDFLVVITAWRGKK